MDPRYQLKLAVDKNVTTVMVDNGNDELCKDWRAFVVENVMQSTIEADEFKMHPRVDPLLEFESCITYFKNKLAENSDLFVKVSKWVTPSSLNSLSIGELFARFLESYVVVVVHNCVIMLYL